MQNINPETVLDKKVTKWIDLWLSNCQLILQVFLHQYISQVNMPVEEECSWEHPIKKKLSKLPRKPEKNCVTLTQFSLMYKF
uniref:Uncharacterized protein n=1 Tax=Parastrongyloides trichosuri TaxID=131310 RepID=A0A0N4ZYL1_PARTI